MRFLLFSSFHYSIPQCKLIGFIRPNRLCSNSKAWRVLFFGTDDFSVETLKKLQDEKSNLINCLEVVTSDKKLSAVRKYALENNLPVHNWPLEVPKDKYDVGVVASFGHLIPERIISSFSWGMINVHASLLPRWRGAAPVVHTILHGDSVTGVTIMKIEPKHFDVGNILKQQTSIISEDITTPELTSQLAKIGANLLLECLKNLPENLRNSIPQNSLNLQVTKAPKVTLKMANVDWEKSCICINRQYRALKGFYSLVTLFNNVQVKLDKMLSVPFVQNLHIEELFTKNSTNGLAASSGSIYLHRKRKLLCVRCKDDWVGFELISVKGYKWMNAMEFYNGFLSKLPSKEWRFNTINEVDSNNKCRETKIL